MGFIADIFGAKNAYEAKPTEITAPGAIVAPEAITPGATPDYNALYTSATGALPGVQSQQQSLADALSAQSRGSGPVNEAIQAQLTKNTNEAQNRAAGAAASQRGMNPALAARQILNQNADIQQKAATDAANLKGQIALGSQGQAGNVLGQMAGQNLQAAGLGQQGGLTAADQILRARAANASNQLAASTHNAANTLAARTSNAQNITQNSAINAGVAGQNANTNANIAGGIIGGVGSALGMAKGGKVSLAHALSQRKHYAFGATPVTNFNFTEPKSQFAGSAPTLLDNGPAAPMLTTEPARQYGGSESLVRPDLISGSESSERNRAPMPKMDFGAALQGVKTGIPDYTNKGPGIGGAFMNHGGKVPAMVSPGERYLPPEDVAAVKADKKSAMLTGELIKGKAKVKGDSLKNDVVPKTLEEGGVVIPRSVTQSQDAPQKAQEFVKHAAKGYAKGGEVDEKDKVAEFMAALKGVKQPKKSLLEPEGGFAKVLHKQREIDSRLKALEALAKKHGVK